KDGIRDRNVTGVQTCALPICYWESQIEEMKEKYIPMSETHVITNQTKIIGFISMVEGYLAALIIDVAYQNNGAGKELLNFEKRRRNKIRLKVYKENLS